MWACRYIAMSSMAQSLSHSKWEPSYRYPKSLSDAPLEVNYRLWAVYKIQGDLRIMPTRPISTHQCLATKSSSSIRNIQSSIQRKAENVP